MGHASYKKKKTKEKTLFTWKQFIMDENSIFSFLALKKPLSRLGVKYSLHCDNYGVLKLIGGKTGILHFNCTINFHNYP
jgi:hypothetical protein